VFIGWGGALSGASNPAQLTMDSNKVVTANFGLDLATALDTASLSWTSGGSGNWFGQTGTTHDGVDAAQSGPIGDSAETWLQTTVSGAGNLSFWWKVSSEANYDWLEFYLDGVLQNGRISGNVDWVQHTAVLAAGTHVLRWRYSKDGSVAGGADAAWVDQVVWTPSGGYPAWISGYPALTGANALPGADPDRDGYSNLAEYALGGIPNQPARLANLLVAPDALGRLVLTLTKPSGYDISDIAYTVQGSSDLATWDTANLVILSNTATTLVVRDNTAGATRRFLRLQVVLP